MATIVLAAAGAALGSSAGGTVLGLSMAAVGRAAGATVGRVIDQRLLGSGSAPVETGRVDRFRLTSATEGAAVGQVYGAMRTSGQVIWATNFLEDSTTTGGGKGTRSSNSVTEYSYTVSLAIALCEGEISRVGRVWADGEEIETDTLNMRVYRGSADQSPDPKISAVEGSSNAPAYRGTAYVVLEDLPLGRYGNRVPQFSFEVMRPEGSDDLAVADLSSQIEAVALIPGTGEYALATEPAYLEKQLGEVDAINVNSASGQTDFETSLTALSEELPKVGSGLLVVSWFGDDLRCGNCSVAPKVEQNDIDADGIPWQVAGAMRSTAGLVPQVDGRPIYGGTPTDQSVVQAIHAMKEKGIGPVFYPFILMEQQDGNALPDPYSTGTQPALPWRGRITTSIAPGVTGTTDGTAAAATEVASFLGTTSLTDFVIDGDTVTYSGPQVWSYRRFILHYAHLCAAAGGVDAFCIGSELRGLTQIRDDAGFPFVEAMKTLAAEVRAILGPDCKISYAADWSEYHGYQPTGTADKLFHLDPLWADANIDFIGVDNYVPLSDWRDGYDHADADWGSIYNLEYLRANVAGGEGYDWYYHSDTARGAQIRTEIADGDGEPWIWRFKDFAGWWLNPHHDRIGGVRQATPTAWVPESKPIWFTEYGCAAINKGTNQPNKFLDPKSSESQLPYASNGQRDDFLQLQYYKATKAHYSEPANNPVSEVYGSAMVDMNRAHAWAWDARPYPQFPGNQERWADGENYYRGHWLNGRTTARTLASVVAEICTKVGVERIDVSQLYGLSRGYHIADVTTGRAALQPLLLAYGIEVAERDGVLVFSNRTGRSALSVTDDTLAYDPELGGDLQAVRAPSVEVSGRIQTGYLSAGTDYAAEVAEAVHPDETNFAVSRTEFPIVLTTSEAQSVAERWAQETRVAQDSVTFALPPSAADFGVGDVVTLPGNEPGAYRIDRIDEDGLRKVEATRVAKAVYEPTLRPEIAPNLSPQAGPTPVVLLSLDLPTLDGEDGLKMPYLATSAQPWPGSVAVYGSSEDSGYILQSILKRQGTMGVIETPLLAGPIARWDRQIGLDVRLISGSFSSATTRQVLDGANLIAIGDGSATGWELVQFQFIEPLGDQRFRLSGLLRGQGGTSGVMPEEWPIGSYIVALDQVDDQFTVPNLGRNTTRHMRHGPAKRPYTDASYRHNIRTFEGISLRPHPVSHLRFESNTSEASFTWIRQTRIGGDVWGEGDVPLAEEVESYKVEVRQGGSVLRSADVTSAQWSYPVGFQIADGATSGYTLAVAQVSARYGTGPFRLLDVSP